MYLYKSSLVVLCFFSSLLFHQNNLHSYNYYTRSPLSTYYVPTPNLYLILGVGDTFYGDSYYSKQNPSQGNKITNIFGRNLDTINISINPFYKSGSFLRNIYIRGDYSLGRLNTNNDRYTYLFYEKYEVNLLYHFFNAPSLTLYTGYGIISNYDMMVYDLTNDVLLSFKSNRNKTNFIIGANLYFFKGAHLFLDYKKSSTNFLRYLNSTTDNSGFSLGISYRFVVF